MNDEAHSEPAGSGPTFGGGNTYHQEVQHSPATARVPDAVGRGVFSTHAIVMQGAHEFLIDFIQSLAPPRRVVARIVLPTTVVPLFLGALEDNLRKYSNAFGPPPRVQAPPTSGPGGQPGGQPGAQPPVPPPITEVYEQLKLPDDMLGGMYANTVVISHSQAEFCFDFICNFFPRSVVTSRVYLATHHVPEIFDSLQRCLEQYRQKLSHPRPLPPPEHELRIRTTTEIQIPNESKLLNPDGRSSSSEDIMQPCISIGLLGGCIAWPVFVGSHAFAAPPARDSNGLPLVFFDDFESGQADKWEPSDPEAWKVIEQGPNRVYQQFRQSQVQNPVRSPFNRALVKDLVVGDLVLDVKLQLTIKDYDHRDMCLFFGFQDPAHLYYVHFGKKTDDHANQIFIVNNEPRKKISTTTTTGTGWTDDWHHARVVRKVDAGTIQVFFDDMNKPVMTATDKTFAWGQVGIGTFDDTGNFDDAIVYGKKVERPKQAK